jgi:bifunctional DNA-binding transcriptional regulator/antitoxin component of YhaV-PrlF toxin-antitoxin module
VSSKGQILIPKVLRGRYGIESNGFVILEPTAEGLLIRGRPSPEQVLAAQAALEIVGKMGPGAKLGDLKETSPEFEA